MCDKKILLTGGAGYIGSHTNAILNAMGFKTLVVDNLSLGHKESLQYSLLDSFNTFDKDFNSHTKTLNKSLDFKDFTICNKHLNNTESNKKRRSHAISFLAQLAQSFNLGGGG